MNHISTLEAIREETDGRTSDQQMHDLKEAQSLLASAERFDNHGEKVSALLFRNAAWSLENGRPWIVREVTQ